MALALQVAVEPDRLSVKLTATGIPAAATHLSFGRFSPSTGQWSGVRGADPMPKTGTSAIARDYEAPLDLEVRYGVAALQLTGGEFTTLEDEFVTVTVVWARCEAWLVDLARPTNSFPVVIETMAELAFENASAVHRVLNRRDPILTTLVAWTPSTELVILTDTLDERNLARTILGSGYPFLLRTSPELGIGNMYLGATSFVEERFIASGYAPERRFRVSCVQVARPDIFIYVPQPPNTYAIVKTDFATYQALKAGVGSYDELAYTFPDDPVLPWLPDDV